MKIRGIHSFNQAAGTLMVTVAVTALLGLSLVTYLTLVNGQNQMVARSQVWNTCMPILEAGIEEALTHCERNYVSNMVSNGWVLYNGTYVKSNRVGDGYYLAAISQTLPYEIISRGYNPMPGSASMVSRTVKVTTKPYSIFSGAMIMKNTIDLNGNNVATDSFDSEDPTKSTNGLYDPTKIGDKGDIGSVGGVLDSVNIGNADVYGRVFTGPTGVVKLGPNGAAGSVAWHAAGNSGVEPGWWKNDLNINFPDVEQPFVAAPPPVPGLVNGVTYDHVLSSGNYEVGSLAGKVLVTGEATLLVRGNVAFKSGDLLEIAPGAKLSMYVGGPQTTISTVINGNAKAETFTYFGLPGNNSITISGNATMTGAVYAPNANVTLNGGVEFYGSIIGKDAVLTGHSKFHYDEALSRLPPRRAITVTSWNEI